MSALCPHLFGAYLSKAGDIFEIYGPQIVTVVHYDIVSKKLVHRKVLKRREHKMLKSYEFENEKMVGLLQILKLRMWGLENFITVLIEENVDNWLAEELFQAYVRHLVASMKKIQIKKVCDCIQTGNLSLLQCSWFVVLEKLDTWLMDIGTSLGCFALPLHPVKHLVGFIRKKLNLTSRKDALKSLTSLHISSDSESDSDFEQEPPQRSMSVSVPRPNLDRNLERSVSTPVLSRPLKSRAMCAEGEEGNRPNAEISPASASGTLTRNGSCPDIIQELEWDDEADPQFYSAFNMETDYLIDLLQNSGHLSRSSFSSSFSGGSSYFQTNEMASQTCLDEIYQEPIPKVSISTQTTPLVSPVDPARIVDFPPKKEEVKQLVRRKQPPSITNSPKVAAVSPSPRRRIIEDFKVKKVNVAASPVQIPVYKDRLKPEEYSKWANTHLGRSWRNVQGGTNVA